MPPRSLLAYPPYTRQSISSPQNASYPKLTIHELSGTGLFALDEITRVAKARLKSKANRPSSSPTSSLSTPQSKTKSVFYLLVPASYKLNLPEQMTAKLTLEREFSPHLSLEHTPKAISLGDIVSEMSLLMYQFHFSGAASPSASASSSSTSTPDASESATSSKDQDAGMCSSYSAHCQSHGAQS